MTSFFKRFCKNEKNIALDRFDFFQIVEDSYRFLVGRKSKVVLIIITISNYVIKKRTFFGIVITKLGAKSNVNGGTHFVVVVVVVVVVLVVVVVVVLVVPSVVVVAEGVVVVVVVVLVLVEVVAEVVVLVVVAVFVVVVVLVIEVVVNCSFVLATELVNLLA